MSAVVEQRSPPSPSTASPMIEVRGVSRRFAKRLDIAGKPYHPFHDVQCLVDGDAARGEQLHEVHEPRHEARERAGENAEREAGQAVG